MSLKLGNTAINKLYLGSTQINKVYLGSTIIFDGLDPGLTPIMTNFRVGNTDRDRVYFDTPLGSVSGIDYLDFIISDKTITAVNTSSNYFTLSSDLIFWNNNTVRLSGGNGVIYDFTLDIVTNNITEPSASNDRYVTVSGSGDGQTSGNSSSLTFASANASAGQTWHIESGDYSGETLNIVNSGTVNSPIKFIGYETVPNDSPSLTKTTTTVFDSTKMPLISTGTQSGKGIDLNGNDYIIVRNIQVEKYNDGIYDLGSSYTILDNVYVRGSHVCISGLSTGSSAGVNRRVINSLVSNATGWGIVMTGERHLIQNNHISSNASVGMDYYITTNGCSMTNSGGHVYKDNYIERFLGDSHVGHGMTFYGSTHNPSLLNQYSLALDNTVNNVRLSLESRRDGSRFNVWRNIDVDQLGNDPVYGTLVQGIHITSGHDNIYENITVSNGQSGIVFVGAISDDGALTKGIRNTIRNSTFKNLQRGIFVEPDDRGENRTIESNFIENCTFDDVTNLFYTTGTETGATGNKLRNCIINNVPNYEGDGSRPDNWAQTYNDYWDFWGSNGTPPAGTGNISLNPTMTVFPTPTNASLKAGTSILGVEYDIDGTERDSTPTIGAIEI